MNLYGSAVKETNYVLRFAIIVFTGIIASSSVLFWKSQLFFVSEYQEMPVTQQQIKLKKQNLLIQGKMQKKLAGNQATE